VSEPLFLSRVEVERIHARSIQQFGGTFGLRDSHTLEAAIFAAQNVFFYAKGDLYDIAAAYCFHIAEAQAFLDGNKRTAIGSALAFLDGNGAFTSFDSEPLYQAMLDIAQHKMGKTELAELLRRLSKT
jgi:death-on-curing protein